MVVLDFFKFWHLFFNLLHWFETSPLYWRSTVEFLNHWFSEFLLFSWSSGLSIGLKIRVFWVHNQSNCPSAYCVIFCGLKGLQREDVFHHGSRSFSFLSFSFVHYLVFQDRSTDFFQDVLWLCRIRTRAELSIGLILDLHSVYFAFLRLHRYYVAQKQQALELYKSEVFDTIWHKSISYFDVSRCQSWKVHYISTFLYTNI